MKKQELLKVVQENVGEIVEYLNQYAEECDDEMGSSYYDGKGLFEAMDSYFMFGVFCEMSIGLEDTDENEEIFDEVFFEIINILFG